MICKLCKKEKQLIKSHIIPNSLHKPLRGDDNEFINITRDLKKSKKMYTGIFDENILCEQCDNEILGLLDKYGSTILLDKNLEKIKVKKQKLGLDRQYSYYQFDDIDYKKFKLFLLSILWRASISTQNFFNQVNLGPYEEKLREMILKNEINEYQELPCLILEHQNPNYIKFPQKKRLQPYGEINYEFILNNYRLHFFITKKIKNENMKKVIENSVIKENGSMQVYKMTKEDSNRSIDLDFGIPISQSL